MPHMFHEPSTLASISGLLATALREEYKVDPKPVFFRAGIPERPQGAVQQRYPLSTIRELWRVAREASGDDAIGLKTGYYITPPMLYAIGYSWVASSTLHAAMSRLIRYHQVVSTTSVVAKLTEFKDEFALSAEYPDPTKCPPKEGIDCSMTALLRMCDIVAEKKVLPTRVSLTCAEDVHPREYRDALRAPVDFNAPVGTIYFAKETLLEALPHGTPDIAKATDKIAEQYIEALDPRKIASQVRQLLIFLLPAGKADQDQVSRRLNRSASTLQRQLAEEGVTYRQVLESTRRSLAEDYLVDGKHSHAQIAFMLGFSDQSNFSRAFKRWTAMSPKQYQDSQAN